MAILRMPFSSTREEFKPLRECIQRAASKTGMSEHTMAIAISHFFEELATQVSYNRIVKIPGIGAFGPNTFNPPLLKFPPRVYPAFFPAASFRNLVNLNCTPNSTVGEKLQKWRYHQFTTATQKKKTATITGAMMQYRRELRRDAERAGVEIEV